MKKLFMMAAIAAAALSCSESSETTLPAGEPVTISLTAAVGESDTRVAASSTEGTEWSFEWEEGDELFAFNSSSRVALGMDSFDESVSTFSGTLSSDTEYKIFYGNRYLTSTSAVNDYILYLTNQDETLSATPLMSKDNVYLSSDGTYGSDLTMMHLGAFMNVDVKFGDDMSDYKLTKIEMLNMPYSLRMDNTTSYDEITTYSGTITVTLNEPLEDSGTVPFSIFPTTIADGESITAYLYFEDGDGNEYIVDSSKTNNSGSDLEFKRATVNTYSVTCSKANLCGDYSGGDGSSESTPYLISTAADLEALSTLVAVGRTYSGKYFKMTENIALEGSTENQFTAIGSTSLLSFQGTFDGGGHTVSGLYINSSSGYQGLFGYTSGATIKNLGVKGEVTSTKDTVGGIVGYAKSTNIVNCFSDVVVSGESSYVGGIVGSADYSTIANCYNLNSVTGGSSPIGGIMGGGSSSSISACYNVGDVLDGDGDPTLYAILGYSGDATMSNCYYSTGVSSGTGATYYSDTNMKTTTFVVKMNEAAIAYNKTTPAPAVKACAWKAVDGDYPIHDFGVEPTATATE